MRRFSMFMFATIVSMVAFSVQAQQSAGYFVPGSSDEAGYLRDELLLEEQMTTQMDVFLLSEQVNSQAGELAALAARTPLSEERAREVVALGNKVQAASREVDKRIRDAEAKAAGKKFEPAGLAGQTWKRVEDTANRVIVAAVRPKADKVELDRLRREVEENAALIKTRLDKLEEEVKKLRAEIEEMKARQDALEAEQARARDEREADKAAQAQTDTRQDGEIDELQRWTGRQVEWNQQTTAQVREIKKELATKAEVGLVTGRLGSVFVISGNKDTRLYALTLGGEYIIRKEWLRVGIGGSVGSSFREVGEHASAAFYFDSRIRLGYCWAFTAVNDTPAEVTLSPYGNTYSSGMPYSDQWGLGGGISLQWDFHVTDTPDGLRFSLEIYGGYARDWRSVNLDPPADGGFYQRTRDEEKHVVPLGVNLGLTF